MKWHSFRPFRVVEMAVLARLEFNALNPEHELSTFIAGLSGDGAVVSFVGLARTSDRDGAAITELFLEHHPTMTIRSLREIGEATVDRFAVSAVAIVHRSGAIAPGEPIVLAAAAAAHRRAAFDAADYLMDRLKTDAVFWKRETGLDGSRWIEPTDKDRADRARWSG